MAESVGTGDYTFEVQPDWAQLPAGWTVPACAVAIDSQDRVYVYNRELDHPIAVFRRDGSFITSWGAGLFHFPHAVSVDRHDNVWVVDRDDGQVFKFTPDGQLLLTIGTKGFRSDTGVDPADFSSDAYKKVIRSAGPFNMPAGVTTNTEGDIFIADGYANAAVHRFTPEGKHLYSWGSPGDGPGQLNLPHGIWIDRQDRVLVADRENNRVQVFTQEGQHLSTWPAKIIGPSAFWVDRDDVAYVPEHNSGFTSVLTMDGQQLARWGSDRHISAHGIWGDSQGDVYVVEPWAPDEAMRLRRVVKFVRK